MPPSRHAICAALALGAALTAAPAGLGADPWTEGRWSAGAAIPGDAGPLVVTPEATTWLVTTSPGGVDSPTPPLALGQEILDPNYGGGWQSWSGPELPQLVQPLAASRHGRVLFAGTRTAADGTVHVDAVLRGPRKTDHIADLPTGVTLFVSPDFDDETERATVAGAMSESGHAVLVAALGKKVMAWSRAPGDQEWSAPSTLFTRAAPLGRGSGGVLRTPEVAINDRGEAIALWETREASNRRLLRVSRLRTTGTWKSTARPTGEATFYSARVAMTPEGTALVLHARSSGRAFGSHLRRNATRWKTRRIDRSQEKLQAAALDTDGSGRALGLLARKGGGVIRASYIEGRGWRRSGLFKGVDRAGLAYSAPLRTDGLALDIAPTGSAVVAWGEADAGGFSLNTVRRGARGRWSSVSPAQSGLGDVPLEPRAEINSAGDHAVAWIDSMSNTEIGGGVAQLGGPQPPLVSPLRGRPAVARSAAGLRLETNLNRPGRVLVEVRRGGATAPLLTAWAPYLKAGRQTTKIPGWARRLMRGKGRYTVTVRNGQRDWSSPRARRSMVMRVTR